MTLQDGHGISVAHNPCRNGDHRRLARGAVRARDREGLPCREPAAGLSPVNVDNLLKIVMSLKDRYGLTVVIIEHILRVVMEVCDRITVLDHGQKIGEGTPDEVKEAPAVVEAYFGRQMDDAELRAAIGSRAARRRRRDRSDAEHRPRGPSSPAISSRPGHGDFRRLSRLPNRLRNGRRPERSIAGVARRAPRRRTAPGGAIRSSSAVRVRSIRSRM